MGEAAEQAWDERRYAGKMIGRIRKLLNEGPV
jgi:hypothetical protein